MSSASGDMPASGGNHASGDGPLGEPTRVALLAREGVACERLQVALREAGAELVLVSDPANSDVAGIRAAGAQAILIAMEPQVEDALDRYETLLADPQMTVIFEEAEIAAQREGWDAARWSRHLAAKLYRHDNVLPPGTETEETSSGNSLEPLPAALPSDTAFDFSNLTLVDSALLDIPSGQAQRFDDPDASFDPGSHAPAILEPVEPIKRDTPVVSDRFQRELEDLHAHAATIELAGPQSVQNTDSADAGAVVVLAGIGGPDAVRQFLAAIPRGFTRSILIQQRLDGGNHEKLVRQMQRATTLPVRIAELGSAVESGHVYILPTGILPEPQDGGLRFNKADDALPAFQYLSPANSAVLMLSGSDPAMVDAAMTQSWGGAFVAGQAPEGCFDDAAAAALVARGASSATPADLAKQLSQRWLSLKD
ncbi:MAG: chemotaxis protein CheB [Luteimonas sp.]